MTLVRFIGDVHGKYGRYKKLIADVENSIQVGDMGVGFRRVGGFRDGELYSNPPHYAMARANHRFIRGNHDNPGECAKHSQWIDDGKIEGDTMFIGGAVSIDRALRQEGYNWWSDEELSAERLNELVDRFVQIRPRVMVTHDCPEEVAVEMERLTCRGKLDPRFSSRSRQAFQSMWSAYSPDLWIFGHWHRSFDQVLRGTRFICLAELEYRDIQFPNKSDKA
jgi:Calcineurin-like phosphoesterase